MNLIHELNDMEGSKPDGKGMNSKWRQLNSLLTLLINLAMKRRQGESTYNKREKSEKSLLKIS